MSPFDRLFIAHPYFGVDERPSGWFICNDGYLNPEVIFTAEPHLTTIKLGGRQIFVQKALTVKIYIKNAKRVSYLPDSFHATCLKSLHNDFADISVAYSDSSPRTHISLQNYSIHFISAEILFLASYNAIVHIKPELQKYMNDAVSLHASSSIYPFLNSGVMGESLSCKIPYLVNNQHTTKWSKQENTSENLVETQYHSKDNNTTNVYASYSDTGSVITQQIPTFVQSALLKKDTLKETVRYTISLEKKNCAYAPIRFRDAYETCIPITVVPCYTPQIHIPFTKSQLLIHCDNERDRLSHQS